MARIYYNIENGINLSNQPNEIEDDGVYIGYAKLSGGLRDRIKYQLNINIVHDDTYSTPYEYDPISGLLEFNVRDGEYRVEITYSKIEELKMILMDYTLESNRLVKDDGLFFIKEVNGTFKEECDLINPSITLELDEFPHRINYVYISLIDKFYFVDNINIIYNKLYEFNLTEDVLMSFQSEIKNQEVFVERNEFEYNEDFPDTELTPVNGVDIDEVIVSNKLFGVIGSTDPSSNNFILNGMGVSVEGYKGELKTYDDRDEGWLTESVVGKINPESDFMGAVCLNKENAEKLVKLFLEPDIFSWANFFLKDSRDYITSLIWYPFPIKVKSGESAGYLIFGGLNTGSLSQKVRASIPDFRYRGKELIDLGSWDSSTYSKRFNDFRDYEGYTKISVFLPYLGFVDIPSNDFYSEGKTIRFFLEMDYYTGQGTYYIAVSEDETSPLTNCRIITIKSVSIGYQIPIGQSNSSEVFRNVVLGATKATNQILTANVPSTSTTTYTSKVRGGGTTTKRYNKKGELTGTLKVSKRQKTRTDSSTTERSTAKNITEGTSNLANSLLENIYLTAHSDTPNSSNSMFLASQDIIIVIKQPKYVITRDSKYKKMFGVPLREMKRVQELNGYTLISDVHLDLSCLSEEEEMIENILYGGIII